MLSGGRTGDGMVGVDVQDWESPRRGCVKGGMGLAVP